MSETPSVKVPQPKTIPSVRNPRLRKFLAEWLFSSRDCHYGTPEEREGAIHFACFLQGRLADATLIEPYLITTTFDSGR